MQDFEAIEMMKRCRDEICNLRGTIERLAPKADAWDQLCTVLDLLPKPSHGYAEDLAWTLDKRISELKEAQKKPEPMVQDDVGGGV